VEKPQEISLTTSISLDYPKLSFSEMTCPTSMTLLLCLPKIPTEVMEIIITHIRIKEESFMKKYIEIKNDLARKHKEKKEEAVKKWDICKKCMGEKFNPNSCTNYECFNWFVRFQEKSEFATLTKMKMDLSF